MDVNGDGKLSHDEIKDGYAKFFGEIMDDDDVIEMFKAVDLDASGYIDYSEFVIACTNEKQLFNDKKLKAAFKMYDTDDSGFIDNSEIKTALNNLTGLTEDQIKEIITQVDKNDDGEISFAEFKDIMTNIE
jgi:calcium-dependent protein kinase